MITSCRRRIIMQITIGQLLLINRMHLIVATLDNVCPVSMFTNHPRVGIKKINFAFLYSLRNHLTSRVSQLTNAYEVIVPGAEIRLKCTRCNRRETDITNHQRTISWEAQMSTLSLPQERIIFFLSTEWGSLWRTVLKDAQALSSPCLLPSPDQNDHDPFCKTYVNWSAGQEHIPEIKIVRARFESRLRHLLLD